LKSIIIVHPFPSKERKTNMKATSETKPTKRGKGRTRRRLALTAQDWEFVERTAREQNVTAAEPAHACRQRTPDFGQVQADLRALEARWDNLTVTLEMIGGNGASALIPLKTIFGKIHPDGDGARRASPSWRRWPDSELSEPPPRSDGNRRGDLRGRGSWTRKLKKSSPSGGDSLRKRPFPTLQTKQGVLFGERLFLLAILIFKYMNL
jgi:hypothetical protein